MRPQTSPFLFVLALGVGIAPGAHAQTPIPATSHPVPRAAKLRGQLPLTTTYTSGGSVQTVERYSTPVRPATTLTVAIPRSAIRRKLPPTAAVRFRALWPKPLPFIPFTPQELSRLTGKPITASTRITLPNGTTRTVGEALQRLNVLERQAAAHGSTLRGGVKAIGKTIRLPNGQEVLKEPARSTLMTPTSVAALELQYQQSVQKYASGTTTNVSNQLSTPGSGDSREEPCPKLIPSGGSATWRDQWGDKSTFKTTFAANTEVVANKRRLSLSGDGTATGFLFGAKFKFVDGSGFFKVDSDGRAEARIRVTVLGIDVVNRTFSGGPFQGKWNKRVDASVDIPIPLVPGVGIQVTVGAAGQAGMDYFVTLSPTFLRGSVTPKVKTDGYVEASIGGTVNLGILSTTLRGGVGGALTFLDDRFVITGSAWLDKRQCRYRHRYVGTNKLSTLAGRLYVFAEAQGCLFGMCVGDRWEHEIFKWKGFGPWTSEVFRGESPSL